MITSRGTLCLYVLSHPFWIILRSHIIVMWLFLLSWGHQTVPHSHYLQIMVSLLFFHFYLHLLCLYSPHLFAAYVTTIIAKFHLPHQFFHYVHPVPCEQPVTSLCFLQQYSSFFYISWLKLNWVMNLASCVLRSRIVVICFCGAKQRNTWTRFWNVFLHSTGGPRKF